MGLLAVLFAVDDQHVTSRRTVSQAARELATAQ